MRFYRPNPVTVEAMRWLEMPEEVISFIGDTARVNPLRLRDDLFEIDTDRGNLRVLKGDWVIKVEGERLFVCPHDLFCLMFTRVEVLIGEDSESYRFRIKGGVEGETMGFLLEYDLRTNLGLAYPRDENGMPSEKAYEESGPQHISGWEVELLPSRNPGFISKDSG